MGAKKSDLSRHTRSSRRSRARRARLRQQMWMERAAASLMEGKQHIGSSFEMEANWQAFSLAVAQSNMLNTLNQHQNQNNSQPQRSLETFIKEEVCESSSDTQNRVSIKLEFETEEEMDKRMLCESHFVNVENINTFKTEPIEENC